MICMSLSLIWHIRVMVDCVVPAASALAVPADGCSCSLPRWLAAGLAMWLAVSMSGWLIAWLAV